ncbi:hypothetical protein [Sphingomonas yabuuchiae]|uniref:hypothetical protein n=1 Tax=Sphingomonas yabuuchiae TaxID=172044 RepID=UPI003D991515
MEFLMEVVKAVGGGIIAAVITLAVNGRRLSKDAERAACTLSIQLTDVFERYALECAKIPSEHASNGRDNPYDYSGIVGLPLVPELPVDDAGWRALDAALAIDARTFGTRRKQSGDVINGIAEYGDAEDAESEIEKEAAILGDAAWRLASRFRTRYKLGVTHVEWDVPHHFEQEFARFERNMAENVAYAAEMWNSFDGVDSD